MVEGARLERVYRGNSIEGSNPSLTATLFGNVLFSQQIFLLLGSNPKGHPKSKRPSDGRYALGLDLGPTCSSMNPAELMPMVELDHWFGSSPHRPASIANVGGEPTRRASSSSTQR